MCVDSHCVVPDIYLEKIIEASEEELSKFAQLYCKVWKEPPWNEDFWTPDKAREDLNVQMAKNKAIGYLIVNDYIQSDVQVLGFSWGYTVTKSEMRDISGSEKLDFIFSAGRKVFYVDELGVASDSRQKGLGEWLTRELLARAKKNNSTTAILRTEEKAIAARNLYKKFGFRDLLIVDAKYPSRTYLVLSL
jgi:ribosomal protein S18 acetylase RimI-like enzyme